MTFRWPWQTEADREAEAASEELRKATKENVAAQYAHAQDARNVVLRATDCAAALLAGRPCPKGKEQ